MKELQVSIVTSIEFSASLSEMGKSPRSASNMLTKVLMYAGTRYESIDGF